MEKVLSGVPGQAARRFRWAYKKPCRGQIEGRKRHTDIQPGQKREESTEGGYMSSRALTPNR